MILADTSIWIEFFKGHPPYFESLKSEVERQNILSAEPVFGELLQGAKDLNERNLISEYWENLPHPEEEGLWIKAGKLSSEKNFFSQGVGLIDAFLITLAKEYDAKIWTLDKKLQKVLRPNEAFIMSIGP